SAKRRHGRSPRRAPRRQEGGAGYCPGLLGLSLLEELLPALEERLELVAGAAVGGDGVHVRPVVRQPLLEVRDHLLLRLDLRLEPLELARPPRRRPLRPR